MRIVKTDMLTFRWPLTRLTPLIRGSVILPLSASIRSREAVLCVGRERSKYTALVGLTKRATLPILTPLLCSIFFAILLRSVHHLSLAKRRMLSSQRNREY